MATIENLKDKANDAAQSAAKAAKYVALVSKKRLAILNEQEKIRRNYTKLGKVYYKDYVTDEEPDDAEYQPLCESISDSFRRINALREEIAAAKEEYCGERRRRTPNRRKRRNLISFPLKRPRLRNRKNNLIRQMPAASNGRHL